MAGFLSVEFTDISLSNTVSSVAFPIMIFYSLRLKDPENTLVNGLLVKNTQNHIIPIVRVT